MKPALFFILAASLAAHAGETVHWPFDDAADPAFTLRGKADGVTGVHGKALSLDGDSLIEIKDSAAHGHGSSGFSLVFWANAFDPGNGQQILAAKNRYSSNERQWGLMLDKSSGSKMEGGRFRLYVWQNGWKTVEHPAPPQAGRWHQIGVVMRPGEAELWVNGALSGKLPLKEPVPQTQAPLTFGGINDAGALRQTFFGALDEARFFDKALSAEEMAALHQPVTATLPVPKRGPDVPPVASNPFWDAQAKEHAKEDRTSLVFDGKSPDKLACDTTLRAMPDGSWVMIMLGGGDKEPDPRNQVFLTRSHDEGKTWEPMQPLDFGFPRAGDTAAMVPSELMVHDGKCTLFFATHNGKFRGWKTWMTVSADSCKTWGKPVPAPGRLRDRTFIRNHIVTRDGRILLPFQHYLHAPDPDAIDPPPEPGVKSPRWAPATTNPRNGVLISSDGGKTWSEHGNIRLSSDDAYHGWAENNIVELLDGRIAMIIRADRLGGVLYYAESNDGGRTWPESAVKTGIPNPGSKATLYPLGGDTVALLHNPNSRHRSPLALWISFDGMKTWPYQRVLVPQSSDGEQGRLNYPDGFVSADRRWLHFAFDDNRHRAVHISARLPEIPALWDESQPLPKAADLPVLAGARFSVIKPYEFQKDGYRFLHGVALCFHQGKLYASFGHNQGGENTDTEEARYCVSDDNGKTWGEVKTIDSGEPGVGVSHGSFLSHNGTLWAFMGAYRGTMKDVHARAYVLDETTSEWQPKGSVIEDGFWPMQEPVKMDDGNWIMAGLKVGAGNPAAVAISRGGDLTQWDTVSIPAPSGIKMWGESTVIADGNQIVNISRYGGEPRALVATSEDYGRTWTTMQPSNLPMATSKPIAGALSTGQNYLVCTTTADSGGRRAPLTIAVSKPGETIFNKVFTIRHALFPEGAGESHPNGSLSYPHAIEHDGHLYIGYSNNGGKVGRVGEGRELWNNNSAELAVIPLEAMKLE